MRQEKLWNRFETHLLNECLTKKRIEKLKVMFCNVERGIQKKFEDVTREDIEKFVNDLNRNICKRIDGKPFSGSTKADVKKFLKQFYKWLRGDNEFYPKEVSWIKGRISKDELPKEKPVITRENVVALAQSFNRSEFSIIVLLLFDSGFRINEIMSVTKKDILWEEYDENQKCFWIQCNASKTEKRKVPVPLFTEDLKLFQNSSFYQNLKDDSLVFDISYAYFLRRLKENSKKLFGIKVTPHALRHSSATYYAKESDGNMNILVERYGWNYDSNQLKTYIRRSGAYQKAGAKKVFSNEVMKIKEENEVLRDHVSKMEKDMKMLRKEMKLTNEFFRFINPLNTDPKTRILTPEEVNEINKKD